MFRSPTGVSLFEERRRMERGYRRATFVSTVHTCMLMCCSLFFSPTTLCNSMSTWGRTTWLWCHFNYARRVIKYVFFLCHHKLSHFRINLATGLKLCIGQALLELSVDCRYRCGVDGNVCIVPGMWVGMHPRRPRRFSTKKLHDIYLCRHSLQPAVPSLATFSLEPNERGDIQSSENAYGFCDKTTTSPCPTRRTHLSPFLASTDQHC